MSRYWISVLVWLLSFFLPFAVMELLAVLWKGCPWATLSTTTMTSQARYPWLTIPITAGLSILFFHIVRFSNLTAGVLDPKKKLEYSRAKVLTMLSRPKNTTERQTKPLFPLEHLSASSLNTFQRCPRQFQSQYILERKGRPIAP
jgi:hypothetical protein